jgi:hypothetical protein
VAETIIPLTVCDDEDGEFDEIDPEFGWDVEDEKDDTAGGIAIQEQVLEI